LNVLGFTAIMLMSSTIFYRFYQHPTFETWKMKINSKYPSADMVRNEIIQMIKGMYSATLCPALSLWLAQHGYSKAYCGWGPNAQFGLAYLLVTFCLVWIGVDFFEFFYHRLGHTTESGWEQHKWHHLFFNPSPFAVIADEYLDQFVRSMPLVLFPLIIPVNIDMMFTMFAVFFYGYGVYLHWGHELSWLDAHHPIINTAFQHYLHHAISFRNKPYHTGFFFKIWDRLFGSLYDGECFCVKCQNAKSPRTLEGFQEALRTKPDYRILFSPRFWWDGVRQSRNDIAKTAELSRSKES